MDTILFRVVMTLIYLYGGVILVTGYWTLTGHCCGIPIITTDWDSCLPVQDRQWPEKYLSSGHCNGVTWRREP